MISGAQAYREFFRKPTDTQYPRTHRNRYREREAPFHSFRSRGCPAMPAKPFPSDRGQGVAYTQHQNACILQKL